MELIAEELLLNIKVASGSKTFAKECRQKLSNVFHTYDYDGYCYRLNEVLSGVCLGKLRNDEVLNLVEIGISPSRLFSTFNHSCSL